MGGGSKPIEPLMKRRTLNWVKDASNCISPDGKGTDSCVQVTIANISKDRDQAYEACPKCRKKVIEGMNGRNCEKCQEEVEKPEWRYVMQVQIADHTASHWVSFFNDEGAELIGMSADDLTALKHEDTDQYLAKLTEPIFKQYNMYLRSKMDTHQDETRLKSSVLKLEPLNFVSECAQLIDAISLYK